MPDLEEKVYALDTRVSEVEKETSNIRLSHKYHQDRISGLEGIVDRYIERAEEDRKDLLAKVNDIVKYKWVLFGAMVMLWVTSGNNEVLKLFKVFF